MPTPTPTPTPSPTTGGGTISLPVRVLLTGAEADDKLDKVQAVLFDRLGGRAADTVLKVTRSGDTLVAEGAIKARPDQLQSARLVVAPVTPGATPGASPNAAAAPLGREALERQFGGWAEPLQINPREPRLEFTIPRPAWFRWPLLCICWVRGKLVKRVRLADGRTVDLPICHARVTICEVDRWRFIIDRLPGPDLVRLRADLLDLIRRRIPIPEPDPEPFFHALAGVSVQAAVAMPRLASATLRAAGLDGPSGQPMALRAAAVAAPALQLRSQSAALLRQDLVAQFELLRPYLCWLSWLEPWFIYTKQCFGPVATDEQGRFSFAYVHLCNDTDQPDIYVSAEQFIGGSWVSIHKPPVRCHTVWNYHCGDELTVLVTDPRAQPCVPDVPTEPPAGVDRWVMPMAVGSTWIRGTAAAGPSPDGWVRPDGFTNYGGFIDAPFGATLGFRQQHALAIPNVGAGGQYYYRWSVRRGSSGSFTQLLDPVSRSYVRDVPGPDVEFPAVLLGPQPNQLFRFKPALFNPADWGVNTAGDPAGTAYYWPVDNSIGDIYAARWTTPGSNDAINAPALADVYQVKLEVFDSAGNPVAPGPGSFTFVLPDHFTGNTLHTRAATPAELDGMGFVFTVRVDNSRCAAQIQPPQLSNGVAVDDCGFLRYTPGTLATLAFEATHPHGHATFGHGLVRGALGVPAGAAAGEVTAATAGDFSGDGAGHFSHAFPVATLLGPVPDHPGSCEDAAFAETLHVYAKATDGNSRLSGYDDGDVRAFALALA